MIESAIAKAQVLTEALPYIRKFQGRMVVIKYGGSLMADDKLKPIFASDIALLKQVGIHPVVVHGGGKEINHWLKKIGKESLFIEGLRYTDNETMELTEMVLSGRINSEVVDILNSSGCKAIGLSGKDAQLFMAEKIKAKSGEDLGQVGDISETDVTLIHQLCHSGYVPVISSIARSSAGETLNLNADYVAAGVAGALRALKLVYLTDVDGIMVGGKLVQTMTLSEAEELLKSPEISGGMVPKLECAIRGAKAGVSSVHIISGSREHAVLLEMFTDLGVGTMITGN